MEVLSNHSFAISKCLNDYRKRYIETGITPTKVFKGEVLNSLKFTMVEELQQIVVLTTSYSCDELKLIIGQASIFSEQVLSLRVLWME